MAIIRGTAGHDRLLGTATADWIWGLAGSDTLNGGAGRDTLIGGLGNDVYVVDLATDVISESIGAGVDTVLATVSFALRPNLENLVLIGTGSLNGIGNGLNNSLIGNRGNNTLSGGAGNDVLNGGLGNDRLLGGLGHDIYLVNGGDVVSETAGAGTDTVRSTVSYRLTANVENLALLGTMAIGGTGNDLDNRLTGNAAANVLGGGAGSDTLIGGGGRDSLSGGSGDDTYFVDGGDVIIEASGAGRDTVWSTASHVLGDHLENLVLFGAGDANGAGNALDNLIYASDGDNVLDGGAGNDTVSYARAASGVRVGLQNSAPQATEGSGTDTLINIENLIGSAHDDVIYSSTRDNVLDGGGGTQDWVSYYYAGGGVTVSLAVATAQNTGGGGIDTLTGFENLAGSTYNDVLTGDAANNILFGYLGKDTLDGGLGSDTVYYWHASTGVVVDLGSSKDQSIGGGQTNRLLSIENLLGSEFGDRLTGNAAANALDGYAGDDTLRGGAGDDTLIGGLGNDFLEGETGRDIFVFDTTPAQATNKDTISGFVPGDDVIMLNSFDFAGLNETETLSSTAFYCAAGAAGATDLAHRVIYDSATGDLYYDADGAGVVQAIKFATLTGAPSGLTSANFAVAAMTAFV